MRALPSRRALSANSAGASKVGLTAALEIEDRILEYFSRSALLRILAKSAFPIILVFKFDAFVYCIAARRKTLIVSWLRPGSALSEKAELALPSSSIARNDIYSPMIEQAGADCNSIRLSILWY
jgi:hypothetical protein